MHFFARTLPKASGPHRNVPTTDLRTPGQHSATSAESYLTCVTGGTDAGSFSSIRLVLLKFALEHSFLNKTKSPTCTKFGHLGGGGRSGHLQYGCHWWIAATVAYFSRDVVCNIYLESAAEADGNASHAGEMLLPKKTSDFEPPFYRKRAARPNGRGENSSYVGFSLRTCSNSLSQAGLP